MININYWMNNILYATLITVISPHYIKSPCNWKKNLKLREQNTIGITSYSMEIKLFFFRATEYAKKVNSISKVENEHNIREHL